MVRLRRTGWALGVCGLLLAQAGCTDWAFLSAGGAGAGSAPGQFRKDELPPAQALRVAQSAADTLDQNGDAQGAIEQYEQVLHLDPRNLHASRRLAVLYDRSSQFDKAEPEYRKLVKATPKDPDLFNDWGWHYYQVGNWKESEAKLRTAVQLNRELSRARCNLALAVGQQGRLDEAYRIFCESGLSEANAHCNIGVLYWTHGNADGAQKEFQAAWQLEPGNPKVQTLLAQLQRSPSGPPAPPERGQATANQRPSNPPATTDGYRTGGADPGVITMPSGRQWMPTTPQANSNAMQR